jgi:hypothetical protein
VKSSEQLGLAIDVMGANHKRHYDIAFNVEQDSQIAFDDHGIYRFALVGAEPMNLVGTQAGVEGVLPKIFQT